MSRAATSTSPIDAITVVLPPPPRLKAARSLNTRFSRNDPTRSIGPSASADSAQCLVSWSRATTTAAAPRKVPGWRAPAHLPVLNDG